MHLKKKKKALLTSICLAKARHHLWGPFDVSKSGAALGGRRHHAHPLQSRGEGEPLYNGHGLT